ncbi:MAG: hypothetical protein AAGG51_28620 [Cyanobacteria bacterium P01_G01_bin.54]
MTKLLQEAITQLQQLPDDTQDAIASRLLAELQDEVQWDAQFAATTEQQWQAMADQVRQDIATGNVMPLDTIL